MVCTSRLPFLLRFTTGTWWPAAMAEHRLFWGRVVKLPFAECFPALTPTFTYPVGADLIKSPIKQNGQRSVQGIMHILNTD